MVVLASISFGPAAAQRVAIRSDLLGSVAPIKWSETVASPDGRTVVPSADVGDGESKTRDLTIEVAGEIAAAAIPVPGAGLAVRTFLSTLAERIDARRERLLEEFLDRFAEAEASRDREEAARMLEDDLGQHEDALMRLVRAVFDVVNSDALAPLARLYGLHRRGQVDPRVWRRTVRLLVEADSGAIDAMAMLCRAILERWPVQKDDGSSVEHAEAAHVRITGLKVSGTLLPDKSRDDRRWTFVLNHHEHVDEAFDLLTDHFFRFEGPAPDSGGYTQLGGHRSPEGYSFNCLRTEIDFLRKVIGPQRPPVGPG